MSNDDAKALANLDTLLRLTKQGRDEYVYEQDRDGVDGADRAMAMLQHVRASMVSQSSRITDLETQVRGDAERLQAAVDTEVELRTRIGELEVALATRDRDVRRKAWRDAIHAVIATYRERRLTLEILGKLLSKDPDHAD